MFELYYQILCFIYFYIIKYGIQKKKNLFLFIIITIHDDIDI